MQINIINQKNHGNPAFQSKFSPAAEKYIHEEMAKFVKNNGEECFIKEYKKAVKTLKRDCKNINPCEFGIIHKRGDYFVYKGFETEEKMEKNDWTCNRVVSNDISKMRCRGYYKLLDILFDIKYMMTKLYREEVYSKLPNLRIKNKA